MAALLFKLNQVPDDEADDIRQLLDEGGFDVYETSAGFFGLGVAAIWLREPSDLGRAQQLIEDYQQQRADTMQADYQARIANGEEMNFWQQNLRHPIRSLGIFAVIMLILAVMMLPFWKTLHL
jgi:hypothetical protein